MVPLEEPVPPSEPWLESWADPFDSELLPLVPVPLVLLPVVRA
jgi:hypothetical protein